MHSPSTSRDATSHSDMHYHLIFHDTADLIENRLTFAVLHSRHGIEIVYRSIKSKNMHGAPWHLTSDGHYQAAVFYIEKTVDGESRAL
jgi:hypothetical protein